jgi:nucleoside-diphosphate-sugar epimerase
VKLLVTGATGYLGWRTTVLLRDRGHEVVALARPGHRPRAASAGLDPSRPTPEHRRARDLVAGCDAVLHFAGVPDPPARAPTPPARCARTPARR